MSDSLWLHGLYSPWNSPGQNIGVGSLSLLQGSFPTQGSNSGLLHCRQILYQLSHKGSPRILEWVACPFSRGSTWPRDRTWVSWITAAAAASAKSLQSCPTLWDPIDCSPQSYAVHGILQAGILQWVSIPFFRELPGKPLTLYDILNLVPCPDYHKIHFPEASLVAQMVKNLPAMQETWVWSLGWEDTLEKGMLTHSSILA